MKALDLKRYRVVLVEPRVPENVGAVTRLLENYDVGEAFWVNPQCDVLGGKAQVMATGPSAQRLGKIPVVQDLKSALDGVHAVVGFTARSGRSRKISIKLEDLGRKLPGQVALVFGREDICLTHDEVDLCSHLCTLDTSPRFPALNLSHSVAVVLSHLFNQENDSRKGHRTLATVTEMEPMFEHLKHMMVEVGLNNAGNPARMLSKLKKILLRSELSRADIALWRGLFHRVLATVEHLKKTRILKS
jgi:tRNA/rRNA methyltransferase